MNMKRYLCVSLDGAVVVSSFAFIRYVQCMREMHLSQSSEEEEEEEIDVKMKR